MRSNWVTFVTYRLIPALASTDAEPDARSEDGILSNSRLGKIISALANNDVAVEIIPQARAYSILDDARAVSGALMMSNDLYLDLLRDLELSRPRPGSEDLDRDLTRDINRSLKRSLKRVRELGGLVQTFRASHAASPGGARKGGHPLFVRLRHRLWAANQQRSFRKLGPSDASDELLRASAEMVVVFEELNRHVMGLVFEAFDNDLSSTSLKGLDFTGIDLLEVRLSESSLIGVTWSYETKWPSDWQRYVFKYSIGITEGRYRVVGAGRESYVPVVPSSR